MLKFSNLKSYKTPHEKTCSKAEEKGSEQQSEYPDVRVVNNQLSTAKQPTKSGCR